MLKMLAQNASSNKILDYQIVQLLIHNCSTAAVVSKVKLPLM